MARAAVIAIGIVSLLCFNFSVASAQTGVPERRPGGAAAGECAAGSPVVSPDVPWSTTRLGLDLLRVFSVGTGITVAVVDTGVNAAAVALRGAVDAGVDVTVDSPGARADSDCAGRGTFVAGVVAARPQDGSGVVGVAPAARLLPVRVTNTEDAVSADVVAAGIDAAVRGGASVVAVTASAPEDSQALRAAVLDAVRRGVTVIAPATANVGERLVLPGYPAHHEKVLAVAAIAPDGRRVTTGESKVDLVAPGAGGLVSLAAAGDGHVTDSGDGVAVAFVAGVAALVRSYRPELDADGVLRRMLDTADRSVGAGFGRGVVDPYRALTAVLPDDTTRPVPSAQPFRVVVPSERADDRLWIVFTLAGGVAVALTITVLTVVLRRRLRAPASHPRTPSG